MVDHFNIYCDESCHLEHDGIPVMVLGAVSVPFDRVREVSARIAEIKQRHNARGELKWTKVSPSRAGFYTELINFFFNEPCLRFRAVMVVNKPDLDHAFFNMGSHDLFYYKMYYYLLDRLISPPNRYSIYLDVKDTRSRVKVRKLREVLCNSRRDFGGETIPRIQSVRSHEVQLLQLTDFLLGGVAARNRTGDLKNRTKIDCAEMIARRSGYSLQRSTPPWEEKFNLFVFTPRRSPS